MISPSHVTWASSGMGFDSTPNPRRGPNPLARVRTNRRRGSFHGHQRAVSYPPPGTFSWLPTDGDGRPARSCGPGEPMITVLLADERPSTARPWRDFAAAIPNRFGV